MPIRNATTRPLDTAEDWAIAVAWMPCYDWTPFWGWAE